MVCESTACLSDALGASAGAASVVRLPAHALMDDEISASISSSLSPTVSRPPAVSRTAVWSTGDIGNMGRVCGGELSTAGSREADDAEVRRSPVRRSPMITGVGCLDTGGSCLDMGALTRACLGMGAISFGESWNEWIV